MGVWIDRDKAVITSIYDKNENVQFVQSKPSSREIYSDQLNNYYDSVIAKLHGAEMVHIFGPSETKGELIRRMQSSGLGGLIPAI
jgi:hypothetical protein